MSLSGTFATMPLRDLCVYLGNRQASGLITLDRGTTRKQIALDEGHVVNVSSNLPREFLGQFLINLGHINEEQFNRAFETQKETRIFLGRILVMIGLVTENVLENALSLKFRETILEAFTWPDGEFAFEPGPAKVVDGIALKVPLLEIDKESEFRQVAWQHIRAAFPSGDVQLELRRDNLAELPKAGSLDEKLYLAIDQGQTIDQIALSLHATDFFLYQRLFALHRLQAVQVKPKLPISSTSSVQVEIDMGLGEAPSPAELLESAQSLYGQQKFRDALALARHAQQLAPGPEAQLLLKQIEEAWLPTLKATFLSTPKVPTLRVRDGQLKDEPLSAPERYLLSRLDGKRSLEGIVRVAPLREFEVLAFFDRFIEQQWIQLG